MLGDVVGTCGAFLTDGTRCAGVLVVDQVDDVLEEAQCDGCGLVSARPAVRVVSEPESSRSDPWWNR